ncbi:hypothetical protein ACMFMG_007819 [Clarireedia jacksonii]
MPPVGVKEDPKVIAWAHQTYIDEPSNITEDLPPFVATSLASTCARLVPSLQPARGASEIATFEMPFRMVFGSDEDGDHVSLIRDLFVPCILADKGVLRMPLRNLTVDEDTGNEPGPVYMYTPRQEITHLYKYSPKNGMECILLPEYKLLLALVHCRTTISDHYTETGLAKDIRDGIRRNCRRRYTKYEWRTIANYKRKEKQDCSAKDRKAVKKLEKWKWPGDSNSRNRVETVDPRENYVERSTMAETSGSQEEVHGSTSRANEDDETSGPQEEVHGSTSRANEDDDDDDDDDLGIDWIGRESHVESILIFRTQEHELAELKNRSGNCRRRSFLDKLLTTIVTTMRLDDDESTGQEKSRRCRFKRTMNRLLRKTRIQSSLI